MQYAMYSGIYNQERVLTLASSAHLFIKRSFTRERIEFGCDCDPHHSSVISRNTNHLQGTV